jgi:hypothetical protein
VISASVRRLSSNCTQLSCETGQRYQGIKRGRRGGRVGCFAVEPFVVKTEIAKDCVLRGNEWANPITCRRNLIVNNSIIEVNKKNFCPITIRKGKKVDKKYKKIPNTVSIINKRVKYESRIK